MEDNTKIEEVMRSKGDVAEPGMESELIQKGTEDKPEIGAMTVTSAGYRTVYDTKTGADSIVNNNNLRHMLRKKRPDGSYIFSLTQTVIPTVGTYKCLLHKDDPNRKHYDEIGLAVCPKDCLASPYQVLRHMQKRHKTEWGAIEHERKEVKEDADREFQRTLLTRVVGDKEEKPPLYVSDKDKAK